VDLRRTGGGAAVEVVSAGDSGAGARLLGDVAPIPSRVAVAVGAAGLRGRGGGAGGVRPRGRASARLARGATHAVGRIARPRVAPAGGGNQCAQRLGAGDNKPRVAPAVRSRPAPPALAEDWG